MADFGYDRDASGNPVPQGWPRVYAALLDRVPTHKEAAHLMREWRDSRFNPSQALAYIVEHGCHRPSGVEAVR